MSNRRRDLLAVLISLAIFLGFTLYGATLARNPAITPIANKGTEGTITSPRDILSSGHDDLLKSILRRNGKILLLVFCGSLTFGLESAIVLGWNGLSFGHSIAMLWHSTIPGVRHPLALVLPHAIPEFLGFILAASIGFRLLVELIIYLKEGRASIFPLLKYSGLASILATMLLFASALIEAFLTPLLAVR